MCRRRRADVDRATDDGLPLRHQEWFDRYGATSTGDTDVVFAADRERRRMKRASGTFRAAWAHRRWRTLLTSYAVSSVGDLV